MIKRQLSALILSFTLLFSGVVVANFNNQASALSGSQFKAGRIIDDGVFFNGNSMSVSQIQNFLNSKVPTCDTNGTKPYAGTTRKAYAASKGVSTPFTCLKSYKQNTPVRAGQSGICSHITAKSNRTAAQIIDDVARACGVSQKVLIILLEKEQSLVTDDWPWPIQYRSATGYGCPDTAPCDSEYYGFFNQVYNAARIYKVYAQTNGPNYRKGQNNSILWHPNASCGRSTVYIENQATAGLYNYTPYRPNQAALNNLYGTGNSCSAYGNRNFWRMFNDWFGSTQSNIKNSDLYSLSANGTNYTFHSNTIGVFLTYWGNTSTQNEKITIKINGVSSASGVYAARSSSGLFQVFTVSKDGLYETYWSGDINSQKQTGKVANISGAKSVYANVSSGLSQVFTANDSGVYETYWGQAQTGNVKQTGKVANISGAKSVYANVSSGLSQVFTANDSGVYETYWGQAQTGNVKQTGKVANISGAKSVYANVSSGLSQVFTANDSGVYETYWGQAQTGNVKQTGKVANISGAKSVYANVSSGLSQVFTANDSGVYETYWGQAQTGNVKQTGKVANISGAKSVYANVSSGLSQVFTANDSGVYETYWGQAQTGNVKRTNKIADVNYSLPY